MSPEYEKRIARLAADRESGASDILNAAIGILREALASAEDVRAIAGAISRAQPSMAPLWNAGIAAVGAIGDPARFEHFAKRVARASDAVARFAVEVLTTGAAPGATLRLVTLSYSTTVTHVLETVVKTRPIQVTCAEGRPALEGRRLAARLAASHIPVTFYLDAAIAEGLSGADAVLLGADAVTSEWFLNKIGTRMLAAAAAQQGIPTYVLAGREKFVSPEVAVRLERCDAAAAEVWPSPPLGVVVRNPYFEPIPVELVSAVISDVGPLGTDAVATLCAGQGTI